MNRYLWVLVLGVPWCVSTFALATDSERVVPATPTYVLTNDDGTVHSYVSIYEAANSQQGPTVTLQKSIDIGGRGIGGGFFGTSRVTLPPDGSTPCVYASNASTGDIASINIQTQQLVGNFSAYAHDKGNTNGIGLAVNSNYLYAGYTASNTIGVFAVQPQCQLNFVGEVYVSGLNGGWIGGMAIHGNLLVVAYGDGSIQSFNIAGGVPISNNDEQNASGFANAFFPESIDITQDGRFAIFGDASLPTTVEVSDLSSGKLSNTIRYTLGGTTVVGPGINSASVRLSPDESLLYISNSQSGNITAAFFDKSTGKVTTGCTSARLTGFYRPWTYVGDVRTRDTTGTGTVLYVAEFGSSIAIVNVISDGSTCRLVESPASPVSDDLSPGLLSIQVYPPRTF